MTEIELRLECLRQAMTRGGNTSETLDTADKFYKFVREGRGTKPLVGGGAIIGGAGQHSHCFGQPYSVTGTLTLR